MTYDRAASIVAAIEKSALENLVASLVRSAIRYAELRVAWQLAPPERRLETDRSRTGAHEALTDAVNILSRNMGKTGEDIRWRAELGTDRREIGDFACFVHAVIGVRAR